MLRVITSILRRLSVRFPGRFGTSPTTYLRPLGCVAVSGLLLGVIPHQALAAQKSNSGKATAKSAKLPNPGVPAKIAVTPVALKSLSARVAVQGWDAIGSAGWPSSGDAVIARAKADSVDVFRNPEDPNTSLRLIKGRSVFGPVVLMAIDAAGDFVRVAIPLRPNGTLAWVRRSDVTLVRSTFHISIDLSTNTMTVFDADKVLMRVPVAAGTGGTPTPRGLFFLKELVPQSPGGALGPFAFGLSGFSNVLTSFGGGEGVIAIHGTNAPGKLGSNVSHGCVRVDNVTIAKMARILPLGTPVEIVESARAGKPSRTSSAWLDQLENGTVNPVISNAAQQTPNALALSAGSVSNGSTANGSGVASATPITPILAAPATAQSPSPTTIPTVQPPFSDDLLGAVTAK